MIYKLVLPAPVLTQNYARGRHWTYHQKERERWGWIVKAALQSADIPKASGPRSIIVELHSPRMVDLFNIGGGSVKYVVDALVQEGIFVDDSPKWLRPATTDWVKSAKGEDSHTVILIEDKAA